MKTYKTIEAVKRSGEVIRFIADQRTAVTGVEVGNAIGLANGTVMCHLATLEEIGFVRKVGDRYELGMGLGLIWARTKSRLEGERDRINQNIAKLEGLNGE